MLPAVAVDGTLTRLVATGEAVLAFGLTAAAVYLPGHYLVVPTARRLLDRIGADQTLELPFLKVLDLAFLVVAVLAAAAAADLGHWLQATEAIAAAATIALGFAAQDVLGNLVSGVFIVVDPSYNIGDWIRWEDREGVIEDISFRVTRVHTFDNELITVPNAELTTNAVVNPVAKDRLRVTAEFGVGYGEDIDRVRDLLVAVARDQDGVLDRPAPSVRLVDLGESAIVLRARFWISEPARTDVVHVRSAYVQRATERLLGAGVELPYPYRQLTGAVDLGDATGAATVPRGSTPGE
ncbi:MAG: mechanosensitive ion channel family protein [Haloarculaceae archaeon]